MAIKNMVGAGGKLYLHTDSGLHLIEDNGKEPKEWNKAQFSSTPGEGPFMEFFFDELQDLVNTSAIFDSDRQELVDAIMIMVTEGFLPAYEDLRAIRAYKEKQIPVLNRKKHYDDFARSLWHGYKDLMPKIAGLLGYNIGFLFQRDAEFKKGLNAFVADNDGNLLLNVSEFLPRQRSGWQDELKTFRNEYLEHRNADVAARVEQFYKPAWAETVFTHAWRTAAELIVFLLETRFPAMLSVTHRTPDRQFSNTRPLLFEVYMCDPEQVQRRTFSKIIL